MDPRPYHYQYRKPRLSNPTYQSDHLYQSIYHVGSFTRMNPNVDKINNNFVMPMPNYSNINTNNTNDINIRNKYSLVNNGNNGNNNNNRGSGYIENTNNNNNGYQRYSNNSTNGSNVNNKQNYRYQMPQNGNLNNYQSSRFQNQSALVRKSNSYVRQQPQYSNNKQPNLPRQSSQQKSITNQRQQYQQQIQNNQQQNYQPTPSQKRQQAPPSQPRSYSQDTRSSSQLQQGYMSNYGSRLMKPMPGRDQDFIYERQQKPYNIISCYPKDGLSNTHRLHPRLTLESKLIQNGQYFPQSTGFHGQNPQRF